MRATRTLRKLAADYGPDAERCVVWLKLWPDYAAPAQVARPELRG